jgi:hypothetical protein
MHGNEREERKPLDDEPVEVLEPSEDDDDDAGSAAGLVAGDAEEWWRR